MTATATKTKTKTSRKSRSRRSTNSPQSARAQAELDAFAQFCRDALTVNEGGPLKIEPFQRRMLTDYFAGTRSSLILVSKKNGKTSILGALALFHLLTTPDAECVIAAASRDQAGIMLRQIRGFIRRSPELRERLDVTQRVISYERHGGQIRILASDVDTVDGAIPTLVLIDELHRHKHPDVYGVLRDGLGPRDGRMVTISTAGDDEESPLGMLRQAAYAKPGMIRDGAYRYVTTGDFAMHEWALDPDEPRDYAGDASAAAKRDILAVVKCANPASWQTLDELRKRHDDPSMRKWQWARFACGVWQTGEEGAISEKEWSECAGEVQEGPFDFCGVDLGWKWDTTAFVPIRRHGELAEVGPPTILVPPRDGSSLDANEVFAAAEAIQDESPEVVFVLDPEAGGEQLAQRLESELGARVVTHSQKPSPMSLAAQRLTEAIAAGRLVHSDDAELNRHVLAAAAKPGPGEGWRLVKRKRRRLPIDGAIALAMAHSILVGNEQIDPAAWYSRNRIELL